MIPITVLTNDNHLWLLNGFQYLWNKYCSLPVTIYGFAEPDNLSPNFSFKSLGNQLPASQWSDGLLKMLDDIEDDFFILLLEDYWLYEQVDRNRIYKAIGHARMIGDEMLRLDLSGNRAAYKQSQIVGSIIAREYVYNIVETPTDTPYQMSFQAAIWHKENLRKVLKSGETP